MCLHAKDEANRKGLIHSIIHAPTTCVYALIHDLNRLLHPSGWIDHPSKWEIGTIGHPLLWKFNPPTAWEALCAYLADKHPPAGIKLDIRYSRMRSKAW